MLKLCSPGMVLTTCATYLLDDLVKTIFRDMTPKLCQTHIWRDITQKIRSNISLNRSDNFSGPKVFLIFFVGCVGEKHRTLWGHISQKSSSGIFWAGWLVPKNVPKNIFGHYPSVVLLEISPTNSPYQKSTYTRTCEGGNESQHTFFSSRHIFTRHLLHQTPFTPDTFYSKHLLHHAPFTPGTFYSKHLLHHSGYVTQLRDQ